MHVEVFGSRSLVSVHQHALPQHHCASWELVESMVTQVRFNYTRQVFTTCDAGWGHDAHAAIERRAHRLFERSSTSCACALSCTCATPVAHATHPPGLV